MTDASPGRPAAVRAAVAAGVDWVQLRDRRVGATALLDAARALRMAVVEGRAARPGGPGPGVALIVNRRLDVALALAAEADPAAIPVGVHLGFDAPPLADVLPAVRGLGPRGGPVGVSAHAVEEVAAAAAAGAHYAHLAPVFDPLSKPRERPALGTEALARASEHKGACRLLAQGGIDAASAAAAIAAGADGVAVTGAILGATHRGEAAAGDAAARLRATLDGCAGSALSRAAPRAEDEGS